MSKELLGLVTESDLFRREYESNPELKKYVKSGRAPRNNDKARTLRAGFRNTLKKYEDGKDWLERIDAHLRDNYTPTDKNTNVPELGTTMASGHFLRREPFIGANIIEESLLDVNYLYNKLSNEASGIKNSLRHLDQKIERRIDREVEAMSPDEF